MLYSRRFCVPGPQFVGNVEFLYRIFSCQRSYSLGWVSSESQLQPEGTETVGDIYVGWPSQDRTRPLFVEYSATGSYHRASDAAISPRPPSDRTGPRNTAPRLIADVVTGKLDVREAAARLPEEG